MKKIFAFIITGLLIASINAQENKVEIPLEKGSSVLDFFSVNKNGFVIKVGKNGRYVDNSKKVNWKIKFVDKDMNLKYDIPVEKEIIDQRYPHTLISNLTGSMVYHIEKIGKSEGNIINLIKNSGKAEKTQLSKTKWKKMVTGNLSAIFAVKDDLYFLSTVFGNETNNQKKFQEKMVLYNLTEKDEDKAKKTLKLPNLNKDMKNTAFWAYEDHDDEGFYLSSVAYDTKGKMSYAYNVIKMNYSGELIKNSNITYSWPNEILFLTHKKDHARNGLGYLNDTDELDANGMSISKSFRAISGIKIDPLEETFYCFGVGVVSKGKYKFFVKKFDFDNKLIWETELREFEGRTSQSSSSRFGVNFDVQGDKTIKIRMTNESYLLSKDGEVLEEFKNKLKFYRFRKNDEVYLSEKSNSKAFKYYQDNQGKNMFYYALESEGSDYLLEFNDSKNILNLLKFSK